MYLHSLAVRTTVSVFGVPQGRPPAFHLDYAWSMASYRLFRFVLLCLRSCCFRIVTFEAPPVLELVVGEVRCKSQGCGQAQIAWNLSYIFHMKNEHDCIITIDLFFMMTHELDIAKPNVSVPNSSCIRTYIRKISPCTKQKCFTTATGYPRTIIDVKVNSTLFSLWIKWIYFLTHRMLIALLYCISAFNLQSFRSSTKSNASII